MPHLRPKSKSTAAAALKAKTPWQPGLLSTSTLSIHWVAVKENEIKSLQQGTL